MSNSESQNLTLDVPNADRLTAIWEHVLSRFPILPDDNFFNIGGDYFLTIVLLREIERATKRKLSVITIYNAPTVASLTDVLQQENIDPLSPLVLLKPGNGFPPIFITHGLGGNVMELTELVKHMRTDHPIYRIQARGLDEAETPYDRMEDMAEYYLDFIRKIQPKGPYLLIGISGGGLVQLEVAQRLSENGEEIGLLAFLDTWPHTRFWPFSAWLEVLGQRARHHLRVAKQLSLRQAVAYLIRKSRKLVYWLRVRRGGHYQETPAAERIVPPSLQWIYGGVSPPRTSTGA